MGAAHRVDLALDVIGDSSKRVLVAAGMQPPRKALERGIEALVQGRWERTPGGGDRMRGQHRKACQAGLQAGPGVFGQTARPAAPATTCRWAGCRRARSASARRPGAPPRPSRARSSTTASPRALTRTRPGPAGSSASRVACTAASDARSADAAATALSIGAARASWYPALERIRAGRVGVLGREHRVVARRRQRDLRALLRPTAAGAAAIRAAVERRGTPPLLGGRRVRPPPVDQLAQARQRGGLVRVAPGRVERRVEMGVERPGGVERERDDLICDARAGRDRRAPTSASTAADAGAPLTSAIPSLASSTTSCSSPPNSARSVPISPGSPWPRAGTDGIGPSSIAATARASSGRTARCRR